MGRRHDSKFKFEEEFKCAIKTAVKQLLNVVIPSREKNVLLHKGIIFFKEISLLVKLVELYWQIKQTGYLSPCEDGKHRTKGEMRCDPKLH